MAVTFTDMTQALAEVLREAKTSRSSGEIVLRIGVNGGEAARAAINVERQIKPSSAPGGAAALSS